MNQYTIQWLNNNGETYFLGSNHPTPEQAFETGLAYKQAGNNPDMGFVIVETKPYTKDITGYTSLAYAVPTTWIKELESKMRISASNPYMKQKHASAHRTQKAIGVAALKTCGYNTPSHEIYSIEDFLVKENAEVTNQLRLFSDDYETREDELSKLLGRFVRPCPVTPRHGFVDSRPVKTLEDARKIVYETVAAEAQAELIAMPFIEAVYSAVYVPGNLTIGTSNDGATAGHSARVIPMTGELVSQGAQMAAGITESPYVELVWEKHGLENPYFVQLRNGPKPPDGVNFIPEDTEVSSIFVARAVKKEDGQAIIVDKNNKEIDFVAWESLVKTFDKGTVVYHPNGSLTSHTAVHCVLNNVPCITSFEPTVGSTIKKETEKREPKIEKIRAGFLYGVTNKTISYKDSARMMLIGCHSTSVWVGRNDFLLGVAMGCAYRLLITAGLGEMRHHPNRKRKPERGAVYEKVWNKILTPGTRTRYIKMIDSFKNDTRWCGSIGGKAWYGSTRYAGEIYNALLDGDAVKALELLNAAVHTEHNTGWTFNKFAHVQEMNQAAANPVQIAVKIPKALYECTIESESDLSFGDTFFKNKKHYDAELLDNDAAEADLEEENEGCEEELVYTHCGKVDEDGTGKCNDADCKECYPNKKKIPRGKIIKAQFKIEGDYLHVQYVQEKMPSGISYYSVDVPILATGVLRKDWQELFNKHDMVNSLHEDSKSKYVELKLSVCRCKDCQSSLLLDGFYINLNWQ